MVSIKPEFSIIIPTLNSERVLPRAIDSIRRQSNKSFEIIIQDGRSSDKTGEVALRYNDSRIRLYQENDEGIFDAMNKGIERALGQWLLFLGSDDALYDNNVLMCVKNASMKNPLTKFIYGDVYTSTNIVQRYDNYSYLKLLDKSICHQSIFYHRSLFRSLRYDLRFKICADWDLNLKVFRRKNHPVYINAPLAHFAFGGASNNWRQHPEYLQHFSDRRGSILRYRGRSYLMYFYLCAIKTSLWGKTNAFFKRFAAEST